jgi:hypothetical protein
MLQGCRILAGYPYIQLLLNLKPKRRAGSRGIYCVGREEAFSHAPGPPAPCPMARLRKQGRRRQGHSADRNEQHSVHDNRDPPANDADFIPAAVLER